MSWRFPIALQILFALVLIGGVMVLPESPRWLIAHGYDHEGLRVIAALDSKAEDDPVAIADKNKGKHNAVGRYVDQADILKFPMPLLPNKMPRLAGRGTS